MGSEYAEDKWIVDNLPLPETGYYVDVGCGHPNDASNTAFLRARGWNGLAIDARPELAPLWNGVPFVCAAISSRGRVSFIEQGPMSRIVDPANVAHDQQHDVRQTESRTLNDIFAHWFIEKPDLLSIDLEGAEAEAMRTLDMELHAPRIIIAEYKTRCGSSDVEDYSLSDYLTGSCGYSIVHKTHANLIYVRD